MVFSAGQSSGHLPSALLPSPDPRSSVSRQFPWGKRSAVKIFGLWSKATGQRSIWPYVSKQLSFTTTAEPRLDRILELCKHLFVLQVERKGGQE